MYIVITRDQCNFCDSAKALLKGAGKGYTEYNVQSNSSKWILTLLKQAEHKTVPQIFSPNWRLSRLKYSLRLDIATLSMVYLKGGSERFLSFLLDRKAHGSPET